MGKANKGKEIKMRTIKKVKTIKRTTSDGLFELKDHIKIGCEYEVDMASIRMQHGFNTEVNQNWYKEIIDCVDGQWLPTEILNLE